MNAVKRPVIACVSSVACVFCAALSLGHGAWAQNVTFTGLLGNKALLAVDGGLSKTLAVGESHQGVTLVAIQPDHSAVVKIDGKPHTLYMGDALSRGGAGGSSGNTRITLQAGKNNHFMVQGQINGKTAPMMVDTGASFVSLSAREANRIGLDFRSGRRGMTSTANGTMAVWHVKLTVSVRDIVINNVEGVVGEGEMPIVLLGNSFLNHFDMTRTKDNMVLEKR